MKTQHCGKMTNHEPHVHLARMRKTVQRCVCDFHFCVCPASEPAVVYREHFECTGLPPERERNGVWLPVRVSV